MKCILYFLIVILPSIVKAELSTIQTNSTIIFNHLDHLENKISIINVSKDGHSEYIIPSVNYDPVLDYINKHPNDFQQDHSKIILKCFHKNVLNSFRQKSHPSIHFTKQKNNNIWEVDIDKWIGSPKYPISLIKHAFLEVLPHLIFHTKTSQNKLSKILYKKYE